MAVEAFLNELVKYGEDEDLFLEMPMKDVPKSCCGNASTEVYDFDKCKEQVTKKHRIDEPRSCDALKILSEKGTIDFIEFKGWKQFIEQQPSEQKAQRQVEKKVNEFSEKISDSLLVLSLIVLSSDFNPINIKKKRAYKNAQKRFILVVDIEEHKNNPLEALTATLGVLESASSTLELIHDRVEVIGADDLINRQRPLLKTCSTIDKFYADAKIP